MNAVPPKMQYKSISKLCFEIFVVAIAAIFAPVRAMVEETDSSAKKL